MNIFLKNSCPNHKAFLFCYSLFKHDRAADVGEEKSWKMTDKMDSAKSNPDHQLTPFWKAEMQAISTTAWNLQSLQ